MNTEHSTRLARPVRLGPSTRRGVLVVALSVALPSSWRTSRGRKVREPRLVVGRCGDSNASAYVVAGDSATPGVVAGNPKRPLDERPSASPVAFVYVGIGLYWCASCCDLATARGAWGNSTSSINLTMFSAA